MPNLTLPPAVPNRGDRATFSSRVDAFLTWMAGLIPQLNAFLSSLNTIAFGGAYSLPYTFNNSFYGVYSGRFVPNNQTQNISTAFTIGKQDLGSNDWTALFASLASSSSAVKCDVRVVAQGDPSRFLTFAISGLSIADNYVDFFGTVTASSSPNPFTNDDAIIVFLQRVGDKGSNGPIQAPTLYVREERASGTASATQLIANGTVKRSLNVVKVNTIPGASVSNDITTLPPGTYEYDATVPAYQVGNHKSLLINTSDNITDYGTSMQSNVGTAVTNQSVLRGMFTITAAKNFEVRHTSSSGGSGGQPANLGSTEVYTEIRFRKVA